MESPTNAELEMLEVLLANMHQNPTQLYDEVDDDDDDDYDDDDDDDDDDDGYYGEHNIHTLLNPYGTSGEGGDMAGGDGQMNIPNAQTMNFIQGLLNMNNSSLSGMADIETAIGSTMSGAMGGMGNPMDGGSSAAAAAAGFLPAMQSLLPNMGSDMAGALAGAFAGGMGSLMDYGHGHAQNGDDYDDDDDEDEDDDDDEDEDDDDVLSDEDDIEDDDDDDHHHRERNSRPLDPSALALGGVSGLMAASLLANSANMVTSNSSRSYADNFQPPALLPPQSLPAPSSTSSSPPSVPPQQSSISSAVGFCIPTPISMAPLPVSSTICSQPAIASTNVGSMSGGTVSRADPLAALVAGVGVAALGAGAIAPIVSNLLGNSGGTTVVNNKLNASNASSTTVIGNNDSLNTSSKTLPDVDNVDSVAASLALAKISSSQNTTTPSSLPSVTSSNAPVLKVSSPESQTKLESATKETKPLKEECDDDKASLGSTSSRSTTSGGGKSDTESFGKKTPSPVPEGPESTNRQEVGSSYASIPDLASATESMRDSDTDNHSEVHNVTANLSDLDNDVHEQPKTVPVSQYPVGALPVVVEHPTYGWSSMLGLDRAKEALKELFIARSFPPVFEGTEGSCKGILLFGPSGSGKTCLARALAKEANNALFVGISCRYLLTHNPYDAIKLVRCMFDQARHEKPAVILFDEIEALCYQTNSESAMRAKDEILAQVRGLTNLPPGYPPRQDPSTYNEGILVLGTTNQPWLLEDRLRRVFAYNIHVKLPGEKPRHELFRMFLQNLPHNINDEEFQCLVSKSEGYSAADINTVIRQASHRVPLDPHNETGRGHRVLTYDDLASIMTQFRCRFNDDLQQKYSTYISAATHRAEDLEDTSKDKKDKPKGVKKFSHRIAKSLAAAVLSVID